MNFDFLPENEIQLLAQWSMFSTNFDVHTTVLSRLMGKNGTDRRTDGAIP